MSIYDQFKPKYSNLKIHQIKYQSFKKLTNYSLIIFIFADVQYVKKYSDKTCSPTLLCENNMICLILITLTFIGLAFERFIKKLTFCRFLRFMSQQAKLENHYFFLSVCFIEYVLNKNN